MDENSTIFTRPLAIRHRPSEYKSLKYSKNYTTKELLFSSLSSLT